jgi:hypothetical protein
METANLLPWTRPAMQSSIFEARVFWLAWFPDSDFELRFEAREDGFLTEEPDLGGLTIRDVPVETLREVEQAFKPVLEFTPEVNPRLLAQCRIGMCVAGQFPDPRDLAHLQTGTAILRGLCRLGALAVFDMLGQRFWDGDELLDLAPDRHFDIREHVTVLTRSAPPGQGILAHTRGLTKFARPEIFMRGLSDADQATVPDFLNELALRSALGKHYRERSLVRLTPPAGPLPMVGFRCYLDDSAEANPPHGMGRNMFGNASIEVVDFDEEFQQPLEDCQLVLAALRGEGPPVVQQVEEEEQT